MIIVMGIMIIGLRIDDIWQSAEEGHLFSRTALAQTKSDDKPSDASKAPAAASATPSTDAAAAAAVFTPPPADTASSSGSTLPTPATGAPPSDEDMSPAEVEVLKQLSNRRETLDKRSQDLDTRETLIKVAEQRVDQKIKEMEGMRQQLQSMVNQVSEGQQQQLDNLVKIYETMKPEDAARIFETLEMPTLLGVVLRMKPKSTAPIMAKMAPDKAKELTVALTKQDQLPQIK
jgi:flagellar motility protein MotE (MotC chaperone)